MSPTATSRPLAIHSACKKGLRSPEVPSGPCGKAKVVGRPDTNTLLQPALGSLEHRYGQVLLSLGTTEPGASLDSPALCDGRAAGPAAEQVATRTSLHDGDPVQEEI